LATSDCKHGPKEHRKEAARIQKQFKEVLGVKKLKHVSVQELLDVLEPEHLIERMEH
jgi:hypothetical protein